MFGSCLPAVVYSYDSSRRLCLIEIEGITSGSESRLLAEISNPIGDRGANKEQTKETEHFIEKGDLVWVSFINGDPRCPLIIGYRNQDNGNSSGWRRWHHANIEMTAKKVIKTKSGADTVIESDGDIVLSAKGDVRINGKTVNLN